jgi:dipeptidyl-peptidase-3
MNKLILAIMTLALLQCTVPEKEDSQYQEEKFQYQVDQFADLRIMRYQVPGFEELSLEQKKLIYYLNQAALCGRDIIWDQHYKHNLAIRRTLEAIVEHYPGDRETADFKEFMIYLKRVWFSNGIHHHYSTNKILPGFSKEYFHELVMETPGKNFPKSFSSRDQLLDILVPVMFNLGVADKRVCQEPGKDMVRCSANNFYSGITQAEVERYYEEIREEDDPAPVSYGLNTKLVKEEGQVKEIPWRIGGMYSKAIEQVVFWLEKAAGVAENEKQEEIIRSLVKYYHTGNLEDFDEYSILWVNDLGSRVDFVNGFIETYGDPLGMKATWEALVNVKNIEATRRTETLGQNAQWFENHSPVDSRFKKEEVKGVTAKVINATMLGGDCYPSTPIGINLPNADWIRAAHGSKSVTIENIIYAYDQASMGSGMLEEFYYSEEVIGRLKKYGSLAGNLHTDLHECLGHGSGKLLPEVSPEALKNYHSPIEEARADLYALYFIMDEKMVDLGLIPDLEVAKAEYDRYIMNGMMIQLTRVELGNIVEQAHMRNRQLISKWCYEKGNKDKVIEKIMKDGKTYFVINDYKKLRGLMGQLLAEVQRVKSEGDYSAARDLVEKYGVDIDRELHAEVLARYKKLGLAPYGGFVNPRYHLVKEGDRIVDVKIEYPKDYTAQMLRYSKEYSFLPDYN